jgi:predicted nucleic acid-binding protein
VIIAIVHGPAAIASAEIAAQHLQLWRSISKADAPIAAVARSRSASVAMHNMTDFEGCGVEDIDLWLVRRDWCSAA